MGVNKSLEDKEGEDVESEGAGDQGLMFGFACNENKAYMPTPIYYAHELAKKLNEVRSNKTINYIGPDGKTQVTVEYDEKHKPIRVDTVVVSIQHKPEVELEVLRKDILEKVIKTTIPSKLLDKNTK